MTLTGAGVMSISAPSDLTCWLQSVPIARVPSDRCLHHSLPPLQKACHFEEERRANRHAETESRRSRLDARQGERRQQQHDRAVLATGKKQAREQERHNRTVLQELKRQARDTRRRR